MNQISQSSTPENLLPFDGIVAYHGKVIPADLANFYLYTLLNSVEWRHDEALIFGKHIMTKRKVAWYGNENYRYTYSNTTKQALVWIPELLTLKTLVEKITGTCFNSCLLNLYHNGKEGMAWHSDDEKTLGPHTTIASVSFGAKRKFSLKHKKTKTKISLLLEAGSLLVMKGATQTHWLHCLPKTTTVAHPRINLTFRTMLQ
jgi:alkylated DNA repair dioxygenase AlkB